MWLPSLPHNIHEIVFLTSYNQQYGCLITFMRLNKLHLDIGDIIGLLHSRDWIYHTLLQEIWLAHYIYDIKFISSCYRRYHWIITLQRCNSLHRVTGDVTGSLHSRDWIYDTLLQRIWLAHYLQEIAGHCILLQVIPLAHFIHKTKFIASPFLFN